MSGPARPRAAFRVRALAVAVLVLAAHARCAGETPSVPDAGPPATLAGTGDGVLFIGNSLTQANDLPLRVADLARDAGTALEVSAVVAPGFSLEDHLASGEAAARLRARRWSVVVLQQGPSTLPESRDALVRDAQRFAALARAAGARPALLVVWPLPGQRQADVSASYRAAAQAVDGIVLPAGDAWQQALSRDHSLRLTVSDGFHPTPLGTYLAALAIHCALNAGLPPAALATDAQRAGVPLTAEQDRLLRESACAPAATP